MRNLPKTMSRAFVKEDNRPEPVPDRPIGDAPNYVTPGGFELLKAALARAQAQANKRDVRYYQKRVETAIVIDPSSQAKTVVGFGASVLVRDASEKTIRLQIVGEDEADPSQGRVSYGSPIAQAIMGHRVGDRVVVARPAGPIDYVIAGITFP